jgi:8-oxo-dGTP diphosphatase
VGEQTVRAAGGLVRRRGAGGEVELAVIHRPGHRDWTFPKGKLEEGEDAREAALREVAEETGLECEVVARLDEVRYRDHEDRPKVVEYWVMDATGGAFRENEEVDELRWLSPPDAADILTYDRDRDLVRALEEQEEG